MKECVNTQAVGIAATTPETRNKVSLMAWAIFATGILYYCYAYLLRVFPSVLEQDLLAHFHITASAFGSLAAFYYFAYAPMQVPVGMTVDRFGARKALMFACCVNLVGVLIFLNSDKLWAGELGRFLIGFGSAFAYVTALKLATIWLPRHFFATATGIVTGIGMLAAALTDIYLTTLLQNFGYKTSLYFCFSLGVVLLFLIFMIIRSHTNTSSNASEKAEPESITTIKQLFSSLSVLVKNPQMWLIGVIGLLMYLPASVFLDVWGISYLKTVCLLTPEQAAFGASMMFFGWIIGSPIAGALSDKLGSRKMPMIISAIFSTLLFSMILYIPTMPKNTLYLALFSLGMACSPHPICFTLSKENNTSKITGTSIAFTNCLIMLGGFFLQPIVGRMLDYGWTGLMDHGIRVYTPHDYTMVLSIIPIGLCISGLLMLALKETYNKALDKE
jgi:MFS family permease